MHGRVSRISANRRFPKANQPGQGPSPTIQSLQSVSDRVNEQGIGGALGPEKLPDYNPGKRK